MPESLRILKWRLYHLWLDILMWRVRKKKVIRFGFLVQELTQWKTELLYKKMLDHPRFEPVLLISPSLGYPDAENVLMDYCNNKGYKYCLIDSDSPIGKQVKVDMVTPQKPYYYEIPFAHQPERNKILPYVVIPYFLSTITVPWSVNQRMSLLCWRQFIDNDSCREAWSKMHKLKGLTYEVTGLPVMDELLTPKEELEDVWLNNDRRKRIIYAPHHTIADMHWEGIGYSTFLENCDFMLEMRDKYKDNVYFVFKPHPSLRDRLLKYWGEEKTNAYYEKWEQNGNSHIELGKYLSLFKYSDAMIHDCSSFTVEYMYTENPVMYLLRDEHHADNMIPYAKEAFDLHYQGRTHEDIEQFIVNVIEGNDPMKEKRVQFKKKHLLPPNGKSASENIIDSILEK